MYFYTLESTSKMKHFLACISWSMLCVYNLSAQDFAQNLVAYWPFNYSTADESGNNHDGTIVGPMSYTSDRMDMPNAALSCNGGYVTIPYSSMLDFKSSDNFSISLWVYIQDAFEHAGKLVVKANEFGFPDYSIMLSQTPHYYLQVNNNETFGRWALEKEKWHHIVYTRHAPSNITYLNGELDLRFRSNISFGENDLIIGNLKHVIIDDVAIYNTVLDISEVQTIYYKDHNIINHLPNAQEQNPITVHFGTNNDIIVDSKEEIDHITVYNTTGQFVLSSDTPIITGLKNGFYFFRVYIGPRQAVLKVKTTF